MPSLPFDDEDLPLFTVGQVSGMLAVQQAFLRRLDSLGVVQPSRSEGGQRRYTRREVTVVQYVVRLADEGLGIKGIQRILQLEARVAELERECEALRAELQARGPQVERALQVALLRRAQLVIEDDQIGRTGGDGALQLL